ncbi:MAG: ornithine carbamoyltransferase [Armatimonadota bacterium]
MNSLIDDSVTLPRLLKDSTLKGRDLLSIGDLTAQEVKTILAVALKLKARCSISIRDDEFRHALDGKVLALLFEKASLRTRVTFDVAMTQLGGHALYLGPDEVGLGRRESVPDVARNLERWVHGVAARVFSHHNLVQLAEYSKIPIINALSDLEHPCQALADFLTVYEHRGKLSGVNLAFVGDGNNVCNSLLLMAAKTGANLTVGCPRGYEPPHQIVDRARTDAQETGAEIAITNDPAKAVANADAIYTDVWVSMGQETEARKRKIAFRDYQVNGDLLAKAKSDAIVMHCLPARRGEEITDDVIDSPQSVVFDQAENRLHAQKAVLLLTLG